MFTLLGKNFFTFSILTLSIANLSLASDSHANAFLQFPAKEGTYEYKMEEKPRAVFVRAWGGAGGGGGDFSGGAGGYVSALLEVPKGSVLKIVVGKGGARPGENGTPSAIFLNEVRSENILLLAEGGEGSESGKIGRGGGNQSRRTIQFSDSLYALNRFYLPGGDGQTQKDSLPKYTCTRSYIEGVGTGRVNRSGGNGLVVLSRGAQDFCYTGEEQTFTVPGGVTSITIKAWGGGGAGSVGYIRAPGSGAGYATRTVAVSPGDKLELAVAGGGLRPVDAASTAAFGGGGKGFWHGAYGNEYEGSGGGGGRSYVRGFQVVAGGGGGAGSSDDVGVGPPVTGVGGGGTGGDGGDALIGTTGGDGGNGGTQSAGGTPGYYQGDGTSYGGGFGSKYVGGNGGAGNNKHGGGGGGGYYGGGGGGGGQTGNSSNGGGGGGGSSFPSTGSLSGSGQTPGNPTDTIKPLSTGYGGSAVQAGGAGFIYFSW